MKKITAIFEVHEDTLQESSECESFADAISQEMNWLNDSGIYCENWKEVQTPPEEKLEQYARYFGDIVFPDILGESPSEKRREIYANPAGWMYSLDGITWKRAPMDIGKIDYPNALFRRIPDGIIVGITADIKKNPDKYQYSNDNGFSWQPVYREDDTSSHHWIFHGRHDRIWFKKEKSK